MFLLLTLDRQVIAGVFTIGSYKKNACAEKVLFSWCDILSLINLIILSQYFLNNGTLEQGVKYVQS